MGEGHEKKMDAKARQRLLASVDTMLRSGRLTDQEADRMRAAGETDDFDDVVRDIRVRHAEGTLGQAVQDGRLTQQDADGLLLHLRQGEHPRSLRARLRGLHRAARDSTAPATARQDDSSPTDPPASGGAARHDTASRARRATRARLDLGSSGCVRLLPSQAGASASG